MEALLEVMVVPSYFMAFRTCGKILRRNATCWNRGDWNGRTDRGGGTRSALLVRYFNMASHPISRPPAYVERPELPDQPLPIERRKRVRAQVHWPVFFAQPGRDDAIQTVTHDLSSNGFYCIANLAFVPGETRECTLVVPTHNPHGGQPVVPVLCKVRVIRVEVVGDDGLYGVGFRIEDYRFSQQPVNRPESRAAAASEPV